MRCKRNITLLSQCLGRLCCVAWTSIYPFLLEAHLHHLAANASALLVHVREENERDRRGFEYYYYFLWSSDGQSLFFLSRSGFWRMNDENEYRSDNIQLPISRKCVFHFYEVLKPKELGALNVYSVGAQSHKAVPSEHRIYRKNAVERGIVHLTRRMKERFCFFAYYLFGCYCVTRLGDSIVCFHLPPN